MQPLAPDDPAVIGGHRLAGRLASGRTGVVYLARDGRGGLVAVKTARVQKAGQAQVRRRLRKEATCARRLPSFCTAQLLVDGTDQTRPYLITEYVEGPSLKDFVEDVGPLEPVQVRALAAAVARALAAIHQAGLVHCDLKPGHVLLAADGPRLIDFGIAEERSASGGSAEIEAAADSPEWMAPERVTGGLAGPASDVFGWGCLMGYATTGRSPFAGADADEFGRQAISQATLLNALEEPLRGLVEAALVKDPADRPTVGDLARRLGSVDGATTARPPEPGTAMLPVPGSATGAVGGTAARRAARPAAATDPGPTPGAEFTTGGVRRPRWIKTLAMVPIPVALVTVLAAVITAGGRDAGRNTPPGPGRTATPPNQEMPGSRLPVVLRPRSYRSRVSHSASVDGAHAGPGSPSGRGQHAHTGHAGRPGAPSRPGGSSTPGSPTVPRGSSPAAPSSPTRTPSPTPSPTTTESG
ncbi:serine/threonine-protein kinase [Actinoallomurus sp. NPDC050550]|uniref:serine/threonine-protein kinase n=1 Tax=Actinoallomurus sp. NPDC050550 TaxID=3154937 RepID=UPI0033DE0E95